VSSALKPSTFEVSALAAEDVLEFRLAELTALASNCPNSD